MKKLHEKPEKEISAPDVIAPTRLAKEKIEKISNFLMEAGVGFDKKELWGEEYPNKLSEGINARVNWENINDKYNNNVIDKYLNILDDIITKTKSLGYEKQFNILSRIAAEYERSNDNFGDLVEEQVSRKMRDLGQSYFAQKSTPSPAAPKVKVKDANQATLQNNNEVTIDKETKKEFISMLKALEECVNENSYLASKDENISAFKTKVEQISRDFEGKENSPYAVKELRDRLEELNKWCDVKLKETNISKTNHIIELVKTAISMVTAYCKGDKGQYESHKYKFKEIIENPKIAIDNLKKIKDALNPYTNSVTKSSDLQEPSSHANKLEEQRKKEGQEAGKRDR